MSAEQPLPSPGDVVRVRKKTRGRFDSDKNIPLPGDKLYLIINNWTSSFGSTKLVMIDNQGEEYYTTLTCVDLVQLEGGDRFEWVNAKYKWMDRTYVPVFVIPQVGYRGNPAYSVTNRSLLVKNFTAPQGSYPGFWISERHCHPSDWKQLRETPLNQVASVRIPEWMARKNNILPSKRG